MPSRVLGPRGGQRLRWRGARWEASPLLGCVGAILLCAGAEPAPCGRDTPGMSTGGPVAAAFRYGPRHCEALLHDGGRRRSGRWPKVASGGLPRSPF